MENPPRFLAIGECMAELAPLEMAGDYRLGYAGDTFNTAWYLRRLRSDIDVAYFSAVGTDDLSTDMIRFMDSEGVRTKFIARLPGKSVGLYMISLNDGERSFSYWRDNSAARLLADDVEAFATAVDSSKVIYFSGITLAILADDARNTLVNILNKARAKGCTIVFDPNLRSRLWPDADAMRHAIIRGGEVSDIVLPSFEDEETHFGDANPLSTVERYARIGATCVIVKNGRDPVHFLHNGETGTSPVAPVAQIVDTTSAGDSFNAGFLATLGTPLSIGERIAMANSVAGQVVGGKGALVPLDHKGLEFWPMPVTECW